MHFKRTCFLILIFLLLGTSFSSAETLKLVTLDYPPYEFKRGDRVLGIAVEMVREGFHRLGHEVEIAVYPWPRALEAVKEGEADAVFTAFRTEERFDYLDYCAEVLIQQTTSLFVRAGSDIQFNGDLSTLGDYRIGVVRGVSYGSIFDTAVQSGVLTLLDESVTGQQNMSKLLVGRFDILVSNRYGAWDILKKMRKQEMVRELKPVIQHVPSYLAFSKARQHTGLRDRFDAVLREMKEDGSWQGIIDAYFE